MALVEKPPLLQGEDRSGWPISQAWLSIFVSWLEGVKFVKTDGPQHLICWNNIIKFLMCISCKKEKHLSSQKCCLLLMETKITLITMDGAE